MSPADLVIGSTRRFGKAHCSFGLPSAIACLLLLFPIFEATAEDKPGPEAKGPKDEQSRIRVAAFRVQTDGVDPKLAPLVTDAVLNELTKVADISMVGPAEMESLLIGDMAKQVSTCFDGPCVATIGKAVGARKAVTGSIVKLGTNVIFTLKLLDIEGVGVKIEGMFSKKFKDGVGEEVLDAIPEAAAGLFQAKTGITPAAKGKAEKKEAEQNASYESTRKFHQIAAYTCLGISAASFGVAIYYAFQAKDIYEGLSSGRYPVEKIPSKVNEEKQAENVQIFTLVGGGVFAALSGYFFYKGYFAKPSKSKGSGNDQYHWLNTQLDLPEVDFVTALVDGNGAVLQIGGRF